MKTSLLHRFLKTRLHVRSGAFGLLIICMFQVPYVSAQYDPLLHKTPFYNPDAVTCNTPSSGSPNTSTPAPTPPPTGGESLPTGPDPGVKDPFTGPKITPTAIVLHWTAYQYKDAQDLVNTLRSRVEAGFPKGRAVQLTVDKQGQVHQLAESLETRPIQTFNDPSWNDSTIGIEIQSISTTDTAAAAQDLLSNPVEYQAVLGVVRELMAKYNIQNVVDIPGRKGILGHYDIPSTNSDPGLAYMTKIRDDLNKPASTTSPPASNTSTTLPNSCACGAGVVLNGSGNAEQVWNFLVSAPLNLSAPQAAGVMGNLQQEHGFQTSDVAGGLGIVQWTGGRRTALIAFAAQQNKPPTDLDVQLGYLAQELAGGYAKVLNSLLQATSSDEATNIFVGPNDIKGNPVSPQTEVQRSGGFENPGKPNMANRLKYAQAALVQFGSISGTGSVNSSSPASSTVNASCSAGTGQYQNPFRDVPNIKQAGIDAGVDYSGDGPVYAIGNGKVIKVGSCTWVGGNCASYQLTDGAASGKVIYVSENCTYNSTLKPGDPVTSSTVMCTMHSVYPYIETGWAQAEPGSGPGFSPLAYVDKCYYITNKSLPKTSTTYGQNFNELMTKLGAPKASNIGGQITCTLPSGWPTW